MDKLVEIFAKVLDVENELISDDTSPDNLEKWDSLKFMQLVSEAEFQFKVNFPIDELMKLKTFGDFKNLINRLV